MKTKGSRTYKVNIVTLGCSKNLVDSEELLTQLRANRIAATHEAEDDSANVIVVNTCGFIDNAKQESIDTILRYADAKERGFIDKLYVTGCLSHRYKDDLEREIPAVDAFYGTNELPRLLKAMKADYKHELVGERLVTTPAHYAYLKISEGCDRPCSFCAIPIMRGKHASRPTEELVAMARALAKNGTKELILIAQDLTYYGLDVHGKRTLADLLRRLSDTDGIEWIRLQYAYPSGFPTEILDVMKERSTICNYLDMPLQHISDRMLRSMRRGITKKKTLELIDAVRQRVPEIALRTTLIAGYPGETTEDFAELCEFVAETKFDRLGIFEYSHEEGTHAFSLADDVSARTKKSRVEKIMKIQEEVSAALNEQKIGRIYKVLFDRKEGGYFVGRTEHDSPEVDNEVLVPALGDTYVRIGNFADVRITDASEFDLYGEPAHAHS